MGDADTGVEIWKDDNVESWLRSYSHDDDLDTDDSNIPSISVPKEIL